MKKLFRDIKDGLIGIKNAFKDVLSGQRFAFGGLPKPGQQATGTAPTDDTWRAVHL